MNNLTAKYLLEVTNTGRAFARKRVQHREAALREFDGVFFIIDLDDPAFSLIWNGQEWVDPEDLNRIFHAHKRGNHIDTLHVGEEEVLKDAKEKGIDVVSVMVDGETYTVPDYYLSSASDKCEDDLPF